VSGYPLAYEDGTDSVPKRRLLTTTRRETTQKITRNNYSFSLLIMYGISYMFRHYIAIFRERFSFLLRNAQVESSRQNIVDGRVVSSDVVRLRISQRHQERSLKMVM
jgi:hypothetical protein